MRKMVLISFRRMSLSDDGRTVKIKGDCFGHEIFIRLSILQLAKVFGTDRELATLDKGFGSEEYEDKCKETKKYVNNFPNIRVWNNELQLANGGITNNDKEIVIFAEDICGWNNEGIFITFPKELYEKLIGNRDYSLSIIPFGVNIKY